MTIGSPLLFIVLLHPDNLKRFSVARIILRIIHGDVASRIPVLEVGSHRDWVANVSSYSIIFLAFAISAVPFLPHWLYQFVWAHSYGGLNNAKGSLQMVDQSVP